MARTPVDYRSTGDRPQRRPSPWRDVASISFVCLVALLIASGLILTLVVMLLFPMLGI